MQTQVTKLWSNSSIPFVDCFFDWVSVPGRANHIPKAFLEDKRQPSGTGIVCVCPDVAPEALESVGLAIGEGAVGKQGGCNRLQHQAREERRGFIQQ